MNPNPFGTGQLGRARDAAADRSKLKAQRDYRALVVKAAKGGGMYALSSDERDELVELATAIGLPDDHDLDRDVERIRSEPERLQAVKDAEIEMSMIPTVSESQAEIDDANTVIRETLEGTLLPYKREQLVLVERREAAEQALREARHMLDLTYSGAEHLNLDIPR